MSQKNVPGKTPKLRRSARIRARGKPLNSFLRSIRRNGRWRGYPFTIQDHMAGKRIDVRPGRQQITQGSVSIFK